MRFKALLILLMVLTLPGCGAFGKTTPPALPTVALDNNNAVPQTSPQGQGGGVTASGIVAPAHKAQLSFAMAGLVKTVNVEVGDQVRVGQVLAQLEGRDSLAAAVAAAQLDLLNAQQALQILQDTAASATAQAQLAVAQAQDTLNRAQRSLGYAQNPASQSLYDAVNDTRLALETAQANAQLATVSQSVQDYTNNYWLTDFYWKRYQDLKAQYDANPNPDSETAMNNAYSDWKVLADKQAQRQLAFQTDQANKNDAVSKAQTAYDRALANLQAAQRGPDADRLAVAQANVAVAEAALAEAQTHYARVQNGPDPDQLALAQARLDSAQATLVAARATLDQGILSAPFTGTVVAVEIASGEMVTPGQPVLRLGDLDHLQVETTDLSEKDVNRAQVGQPATIYVEALGDDIQGQVIQIAPQATTLGGDVIYAVTLSLAEQPSGLRWGMSVKVDITPK